MGAPTGVRHCPECGWPRRVRRSALSLGPKGRYALSHSGQHRHPGVHPLPRHDDLRRGDRRGRLATPNSTVFVEAGGTFIDTADVYSAGVSEEIIGRWLRRRPDLRDQRRARHQGPLPDGPTDPTTPACPRAHLTRALDASLRRLGVDADRPLPGARLGPAHPDGGDAAAFDDAVRAGKIRYGGVSNFTGWQLQKAALLARPDARADRHAAAAVQPAGPRDRVGDRRRSAQRGHRDPAVVAARRRLADRQVRRATSCPTGATRLGENPDRGMEAYGQRNAQERTWRVIDAVRRSPKRAACRWPQVALAWLADRPAVTSVILGARTIAQLDDNLGAADLHLSPRRPRCSARPAPRGPRLPLRRPGWTARP